MDTSGLGLLLTLKDKLFTRRINLRVRKGSQVSETLAVANFSSLFAIESL
jgi:hypothetical protein